MRVRVQNRHARDSQFQRQHPGRRNALARPQTSVHDRFAISLVNLPVQRSRSSLLDLNRRHNSGRNLLHSRTIMAIQIPCQVDIAPYHFIQHSSFYAGVFSGANDEIRTQVYSGGSLPIPVGLPLFEQRFSQTRQGRLRLCLLADKVLLLHDRSQDGRPVRLWYSRRPADEASAARQQLGERESRSAGEVGRVNAHSNARRTRASSLGTHMRCRIRHCISCPHCRTRYVLGFSPYANGSYLLLTAVGSLEEYTLCCSCTRLPTPRRWKAGEIRAYEISNSAYCRGYGSPDEVVLVAGQRGEGIDISTQLNFESSRWHHGRY